MSMRRNRMPWKQTGPVQERMKFVAACLTSDDSFTAICERFGISRQKGYKWIDRYENGGAEALADLSRRPHSNSRAVSPAIVELVVDLRGRRPRWGCHPCFRLHRSPSATSTSVVDRRPSWRS